LGERLFAKFGNMSRIGKQPILIPDGVKVAIDGQKITIKGPKGELSQEIRPEIRAEEKNGQILISLARQGKDRPSGGQSKKARSFWGLSRSLLANMLKGVSEGYEKKLQIIGVGYKANVEERKLTLLIGFSHPVFLDIPDGVEILVERDIISISGIDKELVGQFAAKIRKVRPPEPYKGKGIRYVDEVVRRKAGKKAIAT